MDDYEVIGIIGRGNFGSISKIKRKTDNKVLVWKELDYGRMTDKEKQHIVSEVNILRELKHPNIVRYYDRIVDKRNTKIYIIMEYCEGGDIGSLIKKCKKNKEFIAEDVIWKIFFQLILALQECHMKKEGKILHRDIKPSNVFLDSEFNVKLGDFGLSRVLSDESTFAYSSVGTPYYMSPEQIDEIKYNEKSDIWSLGCFLFELTTFSPPFEATNHLSLALKIKSGKIEKINPRYSDELQRVISWLLNIDMNQRPSIEDLIGLPQIALRFRERRLKENMNKMKKVEESLKAKEEELSSREKDVENKLKYIAEKERELQIKEIELAERETRIIKLENDFSSLTKSDLRSSEMKPTSYNPSTKDYQNTPLNALDQQFTTKTNIDPILTRSNLGKEYNLKNSHLTSYNERIEGLMKASSNVNNSNTYNTKNFENISSLNVEDYLQTYQNAYKTESTNANTSTKGSNLTPTGANSAISNIPNSNSSINTNNINSELLMPKDFDNNMNYRENSTDLKYRPLNYNNALSNVNMGNINENSYVNMPSNYIHKVNSQNNIYNNPNIVNPSITKNNSGKIGMNKPNIDSDSGYVNRVKTASANIRGDNAEKEQPTPRQNSNTSRTLTKQISNQSNPTNVRGNSIQMTINTNNERSGSNVSPHCATPVNMSNNTGSTVMANVNSAKSNSKSKSILITNQQDKPSGAIGVKISSRDSPSINTLNKKYATMGNNK